MWWKIICRIKRRKQLTFRMINTIVWSIEFLCFRHYNILACSSSVRVFRNISQRMSFNLISISSMRSLRTKSDFRFVTEFEERIFVCFTGFENGIFIAPIQLDFHVQCVSLISQDYGLVRYYNTRDTISFFEDIFPRSSLSSAVRF